MNILLTKHHDIGSFCSVDETRRVLMGVHYNKDAKCLEATDGRILIQVPIEEAEEGPPVRVLNNHVPADCIIPAEAMKEAIANIPERMMLHKLEKAVLVLSEDTEHVAIASTDLDTERITHSKLIDGDYPKIDKVFPADPPKFTIHLSKHYLKKLWDYACQHNADNCDAIKCEFWNAVSPMKFTIKLDNGKEAVGLLMPMRVPMSDLLCPVCKKPLSWKPLREGRGTLFCAYGPCPSHAANEGAEADTPEAARKQLCLLIERELEQNAEGE